MTDPIRVVPDERLLEEGMRDDFLSRLAWAGAGAPIEVVCQDAPTGGIEVPGYLDESVKDLVGKIEFIEPEKNPEIRPVPLVWESRNQGAGEKDRSVYVANRFDRAEGMDLSRLRFRVHRRQLRHLRPQSLRKLNRFRGGWDRYESSYVIATGPSFGEYKNLDDFENHFVVTCNSAIINEEFMEEVNPDLLVFGDPIFHFGPSQYAGDFRAKLKKAASRFPFRIAVTERYYFIFRYTFPELMERTIFVPTENQRRDFHWRFEEKFEVKGTQNVLSQLMLPFAAAMTKKIGIIGCDGRKLEEDGYFWGHDPNAQINEKMKNIQEAHPGFFSINYNSYFLNHCENLERFFTLLERDGIKVESRAFSLIPALGLRSRRENAALEFDRDTLTALTSEGERRIEFAAKRLDVDLKAVRLISVNPSLRNSMGHALYQDESLRRVLREGDGGELISLGSADLSASLDDGFVLPVFEVSVWKIHRAEGEDRAHLASRFVEELFDGLETLNRLAPLDDATLFCYLGHPAILPDLVREWGRRKFQCRGFVCNLFSGFFSDLSNPGERAQWSAISAASLATKTLPDFELTFDSLPLARDFAALEKVALPLLPMCPSQVFEPDHKDRQKREKIRVVYPSQAEEIRGYEVICEFLEDFADALSDRFEFVVRSFAPWKEAMPLRPECNNVIWIEGELSKEDYRQLLIDADIVMLPYCPKFFRYRTSSILAESFSLGKPVIAASGSWLGSEVDRLGAGWCLDLWNGTGIRDALERVWNERDALERRPYAAKMEQWCQSNQAEKFLGAVLSADSPVIESQEWVLDQVMRRLLHDGTGRTDSRKAKKKQARIAKIRRQKARPKNQRSLVARVFAWIQRLGARKRGNRVVTKKQTKKKPVTGLSFEQIVDGFAPDEKVLSAGMIGRLFLRSRGLEESSFREGILENEKFDFDPKVSRVVVLGAGGGAVTTDAVLGAANRLRDLGYYVLIHQEHRSEAGDSPNSFFRIFPFPSLPVSAEVTSTVVGFSSFVRGSELATWVNEVWKTSKG